MRTYSWWLKQKPKVRKKYTLFLGQYLSPKELKEWYKEWNKGQQKRKREAKNEAD